MNDLKKWIIDKVRNCPGKYTEDKLVELSDYGMCDTRETIHALVRSKKLIKGKSGYLKLNKSYASSNKKDPGSDK